MTKFKNIIGNVPIYYINLESSKERKIYIEDYFKNNNITNFKRIQGINGSILTKEIFSETYTLDTNPKLNSRDMACTLSHYKAIETVLNDGHEYALIMEDDCNFDYIKYQTQSIDNIINSINDWEIIKLSTIDEFDKKTRKKNPENPLNWKIKSQYQIFDYKDLIKERFVKKRVGLSGLQSYLITNKTCKKLVENKLNIILGASEPTIFKNISPHVVYPPYFSYFFYKDVKSNIREGKSGHAVQTYSKIFWDTYYRNSGSYTHILNIKEDSFSCNTYFDVYVNKKQNIVYKKVKNGNTPAIRNELFGNKKKIRDENFIRYTNTILNKDNKNFASLKGYDIENDGSYKCKYINGYTLYELLNMTTFINTKDKKEKLLIEKKNIINSIEKFKLDFNKEKNRIGDWHTNNLVYCLDSKQIYNVDLEGYYRYYKNGNRNKELNSELSIILLNLKNIT